MQKIKLNKNQQSLFILGASLYNKDNIQYHYLPYYFKSTDKSNIFELHHISNIPKDLKDLILTKIRDSDNLTCEICGGKNIEQKAWVDPNDDTVLDSCGGGIEDNWCRDCGEHVDFV